MIRALSAIVWMVAYLLIVIFIAPLALIAEFAAWLAARMPGRVSLRLICLFAGLAAVGCGAVKAPEIITETKAGEPIRQYEAQKTGDRKAVPVGEKARRVIAQSYTSHAGGMAYVAITKGFWPWDDVMVSTNCRKCHAAEPFLFERPSDPFWKWPLVILIFALFVASIWGAIVKRVILGRLL